MALTGLALARRVAPCSPGARSLTLDHAPSGLSVSSLAHVERGAPSDRPVEPCRVARQAPGEWSQLDYSRHAHVLTKENELRTKDCPLDHAPSPAASLASAPRSSADPRATRPRSSGPALASPITPCGLRQFDNLTVASARDRADRPSLRSSRHAAYGLRQRPAIERPAMGAAPAVRASDHGSLARRASILAPRALDRADRPFTSQPCVAPVSDLASAQCYARDIRHLYHPRNRPDLLRF
jgi:hypothetical protein